MQTSDRAKFTAAIKRLLYATNGTETPAPDVLAIYWNACADLGVDAAVTKIDELASVSEKHVSPAALRRQITGKAPRNGTIEFELLLNHLRAGNRTVSGLELSPKAKAALDAIGGISALNCNVYNELPSVKSAFMAAYDA